MQPSNETPVSDAIIIDGAAIINMIVPGACVTFDDYAEQAFLPYIMKTLKHVQRVDIVWDVYTPNSLKAETRSRRGKGIRRKVSAKSRIPYNWQAFLRIDENKTELFSFLSHKVLEAHFQDGKEVYVTLGNLVQANPADLDISLLSPCVQEEADTRMFLHASHCVKTGRPRITIRTVDTDVVVLAVSLYVEIQTTELWIALGSGKGFRYIAAHQISESLGETKSSALLGFHSFTGCDTVSAFFGRGKKSAWETWKTFPEATDGFVAIGSYPPIITDDIARLERFVVLLYDRTSGEDSVDKCRIHLFTSKARWIDNIPPTKAALLEHIKRATFQAGYIWRQSLVQNPTGVSPELWGWEASAAGFWRPVWSQLQIASDFCQELLKCGCKTGCLRNCKCQKHGLRCTALCACQGDCHWLFEMLWFSWCVNDINFLVHSIAVHSA